MIFLENEPMSKHTSLRVGGSARFLAKVETTEELKAAIACAAEKKLPHFILGNGTNLLVSDKGFNGVVITLAGEFASIEELGDGQFKVGAAVPLGRFARSTLKQGFGNIHKLAGIPGTMGGALYMNAGAYGQEIGTCCKSVMVLDDAGNLQEILVDASSFGYRQSIFQKNKAVILSANFQLSPSEKKVEQLEEELKECMAKRKATQPLNMPNAGSTFKRLSAGATETPAQIAPGYYIEQAGLKGYRIGGAEVSMLHANFIVNAGNASAKDIKDLSEYVQQKVFEKFGIELKREIILLGDF